MKLKVNKVKDIHRWCKGGETHAMICSMERITAYVVNRGDAVNVVHEYERKDTRYWGNDCKDFEYSYCNELLPNSTIGVTAPQRKFSTIFVSTKEERG